MKTMNPVRSHLLGVLSSTLGLTTLAACGPTKGSVQDGYEESLCDGLSNRVRLVSDLNPGNPVEYVALRTSYGVDGSDFAVQQESGDCGTLCETHPDDTSGAAWTGSVDGGRYYLAAIENGSMRFYLTDEEIRAFVGTVDTPGEAALLATLAGYQLDCERKNLTRMGDGFEIYGETGSTCGSGVFGYRLFVDEEGTITEEESAKVQKGDSGCAIGRLPEGLVALDRPACTEKKHDRDLSVGDYFAEVARLEAASIVAFEDLARELEFHGAPEQLASRARLAAREEARHAILTRALARRFGTVTSVPRVRRQAPRPLKAIAIDNAAEGLTRETFGALLGQVQAATASDPGVAAVMRLIAEDETGHAEFSWQLQRWIDERLSQEEREEVQAARLRTQEVFRTEAHRDLSPEVCRMTGHPDAQTSRRLYDELFPGDVAKTNSDVSDFDSGFAARG